MVLSPRGSLKLCVPPGEQTVRKFFYQTCASTLIRKNNSPERSWNYSPLRQKSRLKMAELFGILLGSYLCPINEISDGYVTTWFRTELRLFRCLDHPKTLRPLRDMSLIRKTVIQSQKLIRCILSTNSPHFSSLSTPSFNKDLNDSNVTVFNSCWKFAHPQTH